MRISTSAIGALVACAVAAVGGAPNARAQSGTIARASYQVFVPGETSAIQPVASEATTSVADTQQPRRKSPTRVSLTVRDSTIAYVVRALTRQAKLKLVYDMDNPLFAKRIDVAISNLPIMEALNVALRNTGLVATVAPNGETIVIHSANQNTTRAAKGRVTGVTRDSATGKAVANVRISLQGTKIAVLSGANGKFSIAGVPPGNYVLVASVLGYRKIAREITVRDDEDTPVTLVMTTIPNVLSGVVTTATGEQSRREVGNDITVLDVQTIMKEAPIRTVTDLLETRVPGLTVQRTSGVPGAPSRIRLRGISGGLLPDGAGASNDPILIVDGIRVYGNQSGKRDQNLAPKSGGIGNYSSGYPPPSAIDQIDPNSIDKIEVFKGPSASALYGSDAANGVIVITTKRGQAGPTHVSLTLGQGIDYMPGFYAPPGYYAFGHIVAGTVSGTICSLINYQCLVDSLVRFQALNEERLSIIGRGSRSDASTTISGGTEQLTYSVTGSGTSTLGLFKMPPLYKDVYASIYGSAPPKWMQRPSAYNTWGVRGTLTSQPRNGLRATLTTSLDNSSQVQTSAQTQLARLAEDYLDTLNVNAATIAEYTNKVTSHSVTSNNALQVDWGWRNFPLGAQVGVSTVDRQDRAIVPFGVLGPASAACASADTMGCFSMGHGTSNVRTANVTGRLFPTYWISTALGLNVTRNSTDDFQGTVLHLSPGVSLPSTFTQAGQTSSALTTAGWFIEPNFNFNSRFFVLPGYRIDGGSASGSRGGVNGGIFALFPKLQLSWIALDREGRDPLLGVLTFFRPRVAVGVAGVQPDPSWKLRLANNGNQSFPIPGLVLATLGNTEIHPERSREVEGGFEAELWGQALTLTATYYNKLRFDAISELPVAPSIYGGLYKYYANIGKVRNTGVELSATADIIQNSRVAWTVNASLSTDKNELVTLNGRQPYIDLGGGTRLAPGYPLAGRWARPILGYTEPGPTGRLLPSDIAIGDSAVYMGQEAPNFTLPFGTSLRLFQGMFSVNATFTYQDGKTQLNKGGEKLLVNAIANPSATLGQQAAALASASGLTDYGLIQKVNTFRFNELSLNYAVPTTFSQRLRIPHLTVALQGSNLGLWSNYRGKDPNVNAITVGDASEDTGQLPQPRSVSVRFYLSN